MVFAFGFPFGLPFFLFFSPILFGDFGLFQMVHKWISILADRNPLRRVCKEQMPWVGTLDFSTHKNSIAFFGVLVNSGYTERKIFCPISLSIAFGPTYGRPFDIHGRFG